LWEIDVLSVVVLNKYGGMLIVFSKVFDVVDNMFMEYNECYSRFLRSKITRLIKM